MRLKAITLALLVVFLWGANFIVIKIGVSEIPPLALLATRFLISGVVFLPLIKWPGLKPASTMALIGVFMGLLHQGTLYAGLTMMPAGLMSIILQFNIIIVTLIGLFFFKEKIGWRSWTGIGLGLAGIIVLVGGPELYGPWLGYSLGLLSALFIAVTYVLMKQVGAVHAPTYIVLMSLPVAPFIGLSSYIIEGTDWLKSTQDVNWTIVSLVLFYQSLIIAGSHMIWQRLLVEHPLSQIIPWTLLIPAFGIGIGVIALGESLTLPIIAGGLLTIAGVGIITFRKIQKQEITPHIE